MRPEPGQVLHFSEDPTITRFVPHVAATAQQPEAYVWAVDHGRSPDYWFPRQCPRAMAWTGPDTTAEDRDRIVGAGCGERVHAVEYGWLEAIRTARVFAYRLPAARSHRSAGRCPRTRRRRAGRAARPARARRGPLRTARRAGIQLRVLPNLWPFWDAVTASTLGSAASACATRCPADPRPWHVSGI